MVEELTYDAHLTRDQAETYFTQVQQEFDQVKARYSGFFSRFRRNIREEDNQTLAGLVGILLPLGMKTVVQERQSELVTPSTVGELTEIILLYATRFKNTGVEVISSHEGFF